MLKPKTIEKETKPPQEEEVDFPSIGSYDLTSQVCVLNDKLYKHGDIFSTNYSTSDDERCEQCICNVSILCLFFN